MRKALLYLMQKKILLIKILIIVPVLVVLIREIWKRDFFGNGQVTNITPQSPHSRYYSTPLTNLANLRVEILKHNLYSRVRNWKRFRLLKDTSLMIVVQVHRDIIGLQNLITSLLNARHIEEVLLVFSHSYYSDLINNIVRSIQKCGVLQVYYPYSVQLNENKFPGRDKDDCIIKSSKRCTSRNAYRAERKHHWWWTAHYVFEKFDISADFKGPVVFLEEYHYVAPDFIYMLRFMQRTLYFYPSVDLVTFGRPVSGALSNFDILYLDAWRPPYTFGLAFNRTFWERITANALYFCTFNDHDWSYSLYNAMHHFKSGYAQMVSCAAQRVFSTSGIGSLRAVQLRLNLTLEDLFPDKIKLVHLWGVNGVATPARMAPDVLHGRGGWDDIRDQMFCYDIMGSSATTTERIEETKPLEVDV